MLGGHILVDGSNMASNVPIFKSNRSSSGGAIQNKNNGVSVVDILTNTTTFQANASSGHGGAIYNGSEINITAPVNFTGNFFTTNYAGYTAQGIPKGTGSGGAIYNTAGTLSMR